MYNLSNHTLQINAWIALARDLEIFSHELGEDFKVDLIEKAIAWSGNESKPDIILTSSSIDYSLLVDCKSATLPSNQAKRYKKLEDHPEVVIERTSYRDQINDSQYSIETCYSSFSDLSNDLALTALHLAFVHFQRSSSGILIENPIPFQNPTLASSFPINMDSSKTIPTEYYPYDVEEKEDYKEFVSFLIQSMIGYAAKNGVFDVEEALKDHHRYWDILGDEKKDNLIREARIIMRKLEAEELSEYIENVASSDEQYIVHHSTGQAIQDRLDDPEFLDRVANQASQSTLDEIESNA